MTGYLPVSPQLDAPAVDHEILDLWQRDGTFSRSLEQTADRPAWTFFEGPPTANGMPGAHHIEARVFKDVFPRFKTMQGYHVDRLAGWDCHGLPVELAVEKELGFSGKPQIEAYGVEAFNNRCRESVTRHVDAFTELTERMGYWVNLDEPYWTMSPEYIQSVWWALKKIFDAGLLTEDHRVAPYCPRCGTGLSDHELAQGYELTTDPSVFVRFPLTSGPFAEQASLLIWTTTPWTLPSNGLVAAKTDVTYVTATDGTETLVVAEPLVGQALGDGWTVTDRFTGADMVGWTYQRPFDLVDWPGTAHFVVTEDYVTMEDGTGLVHQAPGFGADDFLSGKRHGVALVNPLDGEGRFEPGLPLIGGLFFKDADPVLTADLASRGLLLREQEFEHNYPHCWRCHTVLIYWAQPSWYIRTTQVKDALLRENEQTTWHPETIKHGRYGDWLNNNVDWAVSRSRYWGTPLPIWRNDQEPTRLVCVESLSELGALAGRDLDDLDPHRPFIDDVTFTLPGVPGLFRRVPEVIDGWFDSGAMPFAQWGYPHSPGSERALNDAYPADFICEAIDQTRGWFYTLMAIGTLVFDQSPYRNVLCLGLLLAEDGRKMSKHLGNMVQPMPLLEEHGADAVRWFMTAGGSPWSARRVGHKTITEAFRKVLLTYWNTVAFQALYARSNGWTPEGVPPQPEERPVLDRWLVTATQTLVSDVTAAFEDFDTQAAGRHLAGFIEELSNWYVRRSRRRFWAGEPSALWTLHETLDVLTRLMAPLTPFVTEKVWQSMIVPTTPDAPSSVHMASWPAVADTLLDDQLVDAMQLARRLVDLGRAARAEAQIKTRQPLSRVLVPTAAFDRLSDELCDEIAAEINVGAVESFSSAGDVVTFSAKGNFRSLGRRFAKDTPAIAAAINAADAAPLVQDLTSAGSASVQVDGLGEVVLTPDDVIVSERPRDGWSVVNEQGETVALDLEVTPSLARAGLAREVVRVLQECRKSSGLEVTDRINIAWSAEGETAAALREHADLVASEVLATQLTEVSAQTRADVPGLQHAAALGLTFSLEVAPREP